MSFSDPNQLVPPGATESLDASASEKEYFYGVITKALHQLCGNDQLPIYQLVRTLTWRELDSGERLYAEGAAGSCMHVLVSGRLRVTRDTKGQRAVLGTIIPGECVGEMALLNDGLRTADVHAVRKSILVELSRERFESFSTKHSELLLGISKTLVRRLTEPRNPETNRTKIKNIALLPLSEGLDTHRLAERLREQLAPHGRVLLLNRQNINQYLGQQKFADFAARSVDQHRLARLLETLEFDYDYVIYQANHADDLWTRLCNWQADKVVLLKDFYETSQSEAEVALLYHMHRTSQAEQLLVLVHPDGTRRPANTRAHLERYRSDDFLHLRCDHDADFGRLGRFIIGRTVGLVLGGGGAKGFAHIGVYRRMLELGIPIDYTGGTSIGAIMAACISMDLPYQEFYQLAKSGFVQDRILADRTVPLVSYYAGRRLERALERAFGTLHLEDLWINFYCVSSNLSRAGMVVHRTGLLRRWIRASISLPGAFPPVVSGDDLLVDGGVMNNLPIDVMAGFGVHRIYAVNLSAEKSYSLNYERVPSTMKLLRNRFAARDKKIKVPGLMTIITKSIMLASYQRMGEVTEQAFMVLTPPVQHMSLLDFKKLDEGIALGYDYAKEVLS